MNPIKIAKQKIKSIKIFFAKNEILFGLKASIFFFLKNKIYKIILVFSKKQV